MGTLLNCVEHKEAHTREIDNVLDESVFVLLDLRKDLAEMLSVVVVSDRQIIWRLQLLQTVAHSLIGLGLTRIRQIARYDAEIGVSLPRVYIGYACVKPSRRTQAEELLAPWHHMNV